MSGHNILQQLSETIGGYIPNDGDLKGEPFLTIKDSAPSTGDPGWIWLSTAGDSGNARIYVRNNQTTKTWIGLVGT